MRVHKHESVPIPVVIAGNPGHLGRYEDESPHFVDVASLTEIDRELVGETQSSGVLHLSALLDLDLTVDSDFRTLLDDQFGTGFDGDRHTAGNVGFEPRFPTVYSDLGDALGDISSDDDGTERYRQSASTALHAIECDFVGDTVCNMEGGSAEQNIVELESVIVDISPCIGEIEVSLDLLIDRISILRLDGIPVELGNNGSSSPGELAPELASLDVRVAVHIDFAQNQVSDLRIAQLVFVLTFSVRVDGCISGSFEFRITELRCVDSYVLGLHRRVLEVPVSRDGRFVFGGGHVGFGVGEYESGVLDRPSCIGELRILAEFDDRIADASLDGGYLVVLGTDREVRTLNSEIDSDLGSFIRIDE